MKICRFNGDHIGIVRGDNVIDITSRFERALRWPMPPGDPIIAQLPAILADIDENFLASAPSVPLASERLDAPVAMPPKILGAPVNYDAHIAEANADPAINTGKAYTTMQAYGMFVKANSALAGPADDIVLTFPDRRTDHEVELVVIIGRGGRNIAPADALDHVAGYTVGLDMTLRGKEVPSYRKSPDGYAVIGPWLVTPDEVADPDSLALRLTVNGEVRQDANTKLLIQNVAQIIAYASETCTLYPGDIIMTGTPAGVGPVVSGDLIEAEVESVGRLSVRVRG